MTLATTLDPALIVGDTVFCWTREKSQSLGCCVDRDGLASETESELETGYPDTD
jgi:hypothetical protein